MRMQRAQTGQLRVPVASVKKKLRYGNIKLTLTLPPTLNLTSVNLTSVTNLPYAK